MNNILYPSTTALIFALTAANAVDADLFNHIFTDNMARIQKINDVNYEQTLIAAQIMFERDHGYPATQEELIAQGYIKPKAVIDGN